MILKASTVRAWFSGIWFGMFFLALAGFSFWVANPVRDFILSIQCVPAFLNLVRNNAGWYFAGIVILTLVFGRLYCSILCPLGMFQDGLIFLSHASAKQSKPKGKSRPGAGSARVWYTILMVTVAGLAVGSLIPINAVDPFSTIARFCILLIKPVLELARNGIVQVLESSGNYWLAPLETVSGPFEVAMFAYAGLLLVIYLAFYHGRRYCNLICPVGAFLSLLARASLVSMAIDNASCTACGRCARICRADCIDTAAKTLDWKRCVSCFDCMDQCPESAVTYGITWKKPRISSPLQQNRRAFLATASATAGAAVLMMALRLPEIQAAVTTKPLPVVPPGGQSMDRFAAACLGCQTCVTVCPTHVLQPGILNARYNGLLQPALDFMKSRCDFTCNACSQVCPSNAISYLPLAQKQMTRIGTVVFEKDICIVYAKKRDCGACAEVCPTHAVYTILENRLHLIKIEAASCIGCGACQWVCPVRPKAIHVKAVQIHETAAPPFLRPLGNKPTPLSTGTGEFPF